jgi:hypothetical protein
MGVMVQGMGLCVFRNVKNLELKNQKMPKFLRIFLSNLLVLKLSVVSMSMVRFMSTSEFKAYSVSLIRIYTLLNSFDDCSENAGERCSA